MTNDPHNILTKFHSSLTDKQSSQNINHGEFLTFLLEYDG